jgi:acyl carrier protein
MEELLVILEGIRPDVNFREETELVDAGILDSFDIVTIVSDLNDHFNIAIRVTELKPENFNSANAIYNMCLALKEAK